MARKMKHCVKESEISEALLTVNDTFLKVSYEQASVIFYKRRYFIELFRSVNAKQTNIIHEKERIRFREKKRLRYFQLRET